jgi:hypothetical protein
LDVFALPTVVMTVTARRVLVVGVVVVVVVL